MIIASLSQAIDKIGQLSRAVDELSSLPRKVAAIAAPKITELLRAEFAAGQDPYGRPWRPLAPRTLLNHGPPPLTDSGRLAAGTRARLLDGNRAGLWLTVGQGYGYFHQVGFRNGRRRVAARRILPQYGLPRAWRGALEDSVRQATREIRMAAR